MFNRWFQGRYGVDQLSRALIIASLIVSVISWFFGRAPAGVYYALRGITLALIAFALFRMLSRNFYARQQELARYMNMERAQLVADAAHSTAELCKRTEGKEKIQIPHLPPVYAEAPGTQGQGQDKSYLLQVRQQVRGKELKTPCHILPE